MFIILLRKRSRLFVIFGKVSVLLLFWTFSIDFLVVFLPSQTSGFNMGYWKLQDRALFDQLKEFTMELWEGSNGIELARYIMEHAQDLEKMVIVHLPRHSDVERELSKSKMISNATLVFVPYYSVFP